MNGEGERKDTFDQHVNPGHNAVWNEAVSGALYCISPNKLLLLANQIFYFNKLSSAFAFLPSTVCIYVYEYHSSGLGKKRRKRIATYKDGRYLLTDY